MRVFVSCASQDRAWASRLADGLRRRGVDVLPSSAELGPGERWDDVVRHAIAKADACLVLVSGASDPSEPRLSKEWSAIQECSWEKADLRIYPIQLGDADVPPFLRKWQALRLPKATDKLGPATDRVAALLEQPPLSMADDEAAVPSALAARFANLERTVAKLKAEERAERRNATRG